MTEPPNATTAPSATTAPLRERHDPRMPNPHPNAPGPPQTVAHACPHCTYMHRVTFHEPPAPGAVYHYACPYTGKDTRLDPSSLPRVDAPSLFGLIVAVRADSTESGPHAS